jgi:purine nucleosidase
MDDAPAVWLDCDTGIDDALALLYLTAAPCALLGVSTVAGNCALERATANTLGVLEAAGAAAVPVHPGAAGPLVGRPQDARHVHGDDGIGGCGDLLPTPSRGVSAPRAVAALAAALRARPGEMTLVASGPLTNLALLVREDPEAAGLARRVVVMGGTVLEPGNVAPTVEFNIGADPEAAVQVLGADWPVTLVGLDVTRRVLATADDAADLARAGTPPARLAAALISAYTRSYIRLGFPPAAPLHDPLAAAIALDPGLAETVDVPVDIETQGAFTRGMVVADLRVRARPALLGDRRVVRVCLGIDAARARQELLARWARGSGRPRNPQR